MNRLSKIHDFLCDSNRLNSELHWITKGWYIILLIFSSIYVLRNFDALATQCFICKFDGNSLIFILWLLLLLMPFVNSIEGYGFKFNKEQAKQDEIAHEIKTLKENVINPSNEIDLTQLEKQYKNNLKERTDEQL